MTGDVDPRGSVTRPGISLDDVNARARATLRSFRGPGGHSAAFGQTIVLGMVVVNGNSSATAHNIVANEGLYRLGFAIPLAAVGFHIGVSTATGISPHADS